MHVGELGKIAFDENGDVIGKYMVQQMRNNRIDTIAVWEQETEDFEYFDDSVHWGNVNLETADERFLGVAESVCSKPCKTG